MSKLKGVIYILTNPSFPEYVKIGYADDIERRLKQLNRSECVPYAFRVYATYEVASRLSDTKLHSIIDRLNPNLRAIENSNGQNRVREFYAMSPDDAYAILEAIAEIHGCLDKLNLVEPDAKEKQAEKEAKEIIAEGKQRLSPFAFSKCNIPIGATLEFWPSINVNSGITCLVLDDKHVQYEGRIYSLSGLAGSLLNSKAVQGPRYFKYGGEWLMDIRDRFENQFKQSSF